MAGTTRESFESRRTVTVTLADGTEILCRRATVRDLMQRQALSLPIFQATLEAEKSEPGQSPDRLKTIRQSLVRVAVFAALEPVLSETREPAPSAAIWVDLLSLDELGDIYGAVVGSAGSMGAADAESFRRGELQPAAGAAPDGDGVRAEAEQLGASADGGQQHGGALVSA